MDSKGLGVAIAEARGVAWSDGPREANDAEGESVGEGELSLADAGWGDDGHNCYGLIVSQQACPTPDCRNADLDALQHVWSGERRESDDLVDSEEMTTTWRERFSLEPPGTFLGRQAGG